MAQRERSALKNFFQTGDKPSQAQYSDLIDSGVYTQEQNNVSDLDFRLDNSSDQALIGIERTGTQVFSELSWNYTGGKHISASGDISASGTVHSKFIKIPQDGLNNGNDASIYFGTGSSADSNGRIYDDGTTLVLGYNDSDILNVFSDKVTVGSELLVLGSNGLGVGGNSNMNVPERITVEGNISASGFIKTNTNIIATGITASGAISSSGTLITGPTIQLGGSSSDSIRFKNHVQGGVRLSNGDGSTTYLTVDGATVVINLSLIPTSDPNEAGQLFRDGTDLKISLG